MHLFYQPDLSAQQIQLSEEESKHCAKVLRLTINDQIILLDGIGTKAIGQIIDNNPKKCLVNIIQRQIEPKQFDYTLKLFVAPPKNSERIEWFIEKSVELGIDEIQFITTRNSERNKVNLERCEKIAISAMKQSKQWYKPKIYGPLPLESIYKNPHKKGLNLIAWCEANNAQSQTLKQALQNTSDKNINIFIGPEGDFTPEEVAETMEQGFKQVSLGPSILRTETAAVFAAASCRFHFEC